MEAKHLEIARQVFAEVFGHNLKIQGVKLSGEQAKEARAERMEGFEEDKSLLDNMLKVFGGKVVE